MAATHVGQSTKTDCTCVVLVLRLYWSEIDEIQCCAAGQDRRSLVFVLPGATILTTWERNKGRLMGVLTKGRVTAQNSAADEVVRQSTS